MARAVGDKQVLEQGGAPGWIVVQREIAERVDDLKASLAKSWRAAQTTREPGGVRVTLTPAAAKASAAWRQRLARFEEDVRELDKRVRDYNLMCPPNCQARLTAYRELLTSTAQHSTVLLI